MRYYVILIMQIFSPILWISFIPLLVVSFDALKFLILMKYNLHIFFFFCSCLFAF